MTYVKPVFIPTFFHKEEKKENAYCKKKKLLAKCGDTAQIS
jgi:hypothetical protein